MFRKRVKVRVEIPCAGRDDCFCYGHAFHASATINDPAHESDVRAQLMELLEDRIKRFETVHYGEAPSA